MNCIEISEGCHQNREGTGANVQNACALELWCVEGLGPGELNLVEMGEVSVAC